MPTCVWGIGMWMTEPSKSWHMQISDAYSPQAIWQYFLIELGVVPRAWHCTHIDDLSDRMKIQQLEENLEGPCGMTNRQNDRQGIRYWFLFHIHHHTDLHLRQGCQNVNTLSAFNGTWVGP